MEEKSKSLYVKRTQRDYPMSFKLSVVREVERGELSARGAMLVEPHVAPEDEEGRGLDKYRL